MMGFPIPGGSKSLSRESVLRNRQWGGVNCHDRGHFFVVGVNCLDW